MEKPREEPTVLVHVPQEIIVEILSRLPVKTLSRFKCVCKLWKSLISDRKFRLCSIGREKVVFCCSEYKELKPRTYTHEWGKVIYSLDHELSLQKLPNPIGGGVDHRIQLLGSCNGLLLICSTSANFPTSGHVHLWNPSNFPTSGHVHLWNPSTGCCRELPELKGLVEAVPFDILSGLCFDKSSDDYNAVLINTRSAVHVAGLRSRIRWTYISFPYRFPDDITITGPGVLANGHLHWVVRAKIGDGCLVVYFDETTNTFNSLSTIMPFNRRVNTCLLGVLDGRLCVLRSSSYGRREALIMREYGVEESWTPLFNLADLDYPEVPLYCTRLGWEIVLWGEYSIWTYNATNKSLKDTRVRMKDSMGLAHQINLSPLLYVESLASVEVEQASVEVEQQQRETILSNKEQIH